MPPRPQTTIEEIETLNEDAYYFLMQLIHQIALQIYKESSEVREMGLEKSMETIIKLINSGEAKLVLDEENDEISITVYDEEFGGYIEKGLF
jgi:uncharacterized protein YheU (UPF0270 family)